MCIRDRIYIQKETQVCRSIDPWGGSYYIETLTDQIAHRAWEHIQEVEKIGGMAKAIETGLPKMRAARMLWAKVVKSFGAENPKSLMLLSLIHI